MRSIKWFFSAFLPVALFFWTPSSFAQRDSCRDILQYGIFEEKNIKNDSSSFVAMKSMFCSSSYQEAKKLSKKIREGGNSAELNIMYGIFGAGGGASSKNMDEMSQEEYNTWRTSSCSNKEYTSQTNRSDFLLQRVASDAIVDKWAACMLDKEGPALIFETTPNPEDLVLTFSFRTVNTTGSPRIIDTTLKNGRCDAFIKLKNTEFSPGRRSFLVSRKADKTVSAIVNTTFRGQSLSDAAYATAIPNSIIKDFDVIANVENNDTGITLEPGDIVEIKYITGNWRLCDKCNEHPFTDASGAIGPMTDPNFRKVGGRWAELIGWINKHDDKYAFPVGNYIVFDAKVPGRLFLATNDVPQSRHPVGYSDNVGKISVRITVKRPN